MLGAVAQASMRRGGRRKMPQKVLFQARPMPLVAQTRDAEKMRLIEEYQTQGETVRDIIRWLELGKTGDLEADRLLFQQMAFLGKRLEQTARMRLATLPPV